MYLGNKKYLVASVAGGGIGILLCIFLSIFLNVSPDGLVKNFLLVPFLAICSPLIELGATLFGQNPIFVLPFVGMCWGFLGIIVSLSGMVFVSLVKKHRKGVRSVP